MRELKFRAWDNLQKVMYWLAVPERPDRHITTHEFLQRLSVEIMQYTGLKDKNGKEIYEGDIIKSYTDYPLTLNTHPQDLIEVVYDSGYFGVRDIGTKDGRIGNICFVNPDDWLDVEVVGNLYETPELMN